MNRIKLFFKKWWPIAVPVFALLFAAAFFCATEEQLRYGEMHIERNIVTSENNLGELISGTVVEQHFVPKVDEITDVSILFATYNRQNNGELEVAIILGETGTELFSTVIQVSELQDNTFFALPIEPLSNVQEKELILKIVSQSGDYGDAVTIYYDNQNIREHESLYFNGQLLPGQLNIEVRGHDYVNYSLYFWLIALTVFIASMAYGIYVLQMEKRGQGTLAGNAIRGLAHYGFLLRQLVARDFKTKYKRSVLGMLWSLLNPLLTMTVQYIVFSKLFRFEILNYPVYLLSGIVFFNYMSDATSQGLMSIVSNASLINKVYVPKYIYPFSRVLSCGVNFLLSLVALYIMIICTGMQITVNHIFVLYGVLCTILFTLGVTFLLSALMVFFRDIQFLYGVFLQMWIYLTPLFYPESILPEWVMRIVEFNPMYHFIRFIRIIILNGVLPEFKAWVYCAVFALVPFAVGFWVFRKLQKRFILYI